MPNPIAYGYAEDPFVLKLIEELAKSKPKVKSTSIAEMEKIIAFLGHREVIDLAKRLESRGFGTYIVGRRGHPTRIEWARSVGTILQDIQSRNAPATQSESAATPHIDRNAPRGTPSEMTLALRGGGSISIRIEGLLSPEDIADVQGWLKIVLNRGS